MTKEYKIRFNTGYKDTPGLFWKVIVDGEEFLVADVTVESIKTFTTSHLLPTGERKWSTTCFVNDHLFDKENKMYIFDN